ncbi:MAG: CHAD domain-containing protein [Proteobacteria bacterium]|nr:MAG: CHAD domain-containing protein [Pseudomonadota bacterium]
MMLLMKESPAEKKNHQLRRTIKSVRALSRLLKSLGAKGAGRVNKNLGAIGAKLSEERDSTVRNAWLAKNGFPELMESAPKPTRLIPLRRQVAKEEMRLRRQAARLKISAPQIERAIKHSAKKVKTARKAAKETKQDEDFHRLRKRVRDLSEQLKLLRIEPPAGLRRAIKQLGRAQDTSVVHASLRKVPGARMARKQAKKEGRARRLSALEESVRIEAIPSSGLGAMLRKRILSPETSSLPRI